MRDILQISRLEQTAKRFAMDGICISMPQTTVVLKDGRHFGAKERKPEGG
jgi:hypothetical protein